MRHEKRRTRAVLVLGLAVLAVTAMGAKHAGERPPAVAGQFYPADAGKLEAAVKAFLEDAVPPKGERPLALVVPHAGYVYSGQIAADAYRQAMGYDYDVVVILGTNHTRPGFDGVSVYTGTAYRTPLGAAPVDQDLAEALLAQDPRFTFDSRVHEKEHSVEVQVPFVQVAFPGVKILPAVVGTPDSALCARLGRALAAVLRGRRPLIVASSDLSHYPAYEDAVASDRAVLQAMVTLDGAALREAIRTQMERGRPGLVTCACGEGPILAAMEAARILGANRGIVVSYANSGDTALGNRGRVVGYGAVAFAAGTPGTDTDALIRPEEEEATTEPPTAEEGNLLLGFARKTIQRYLETETAPLARGFPPRLRRLQGVFVTLTENGQLRGCIGHTAVDLPVAQAVGAMALQAAFNDPRFPPLERKELDAIRIEVSLLTPLRRVSGPEAVRLGTDGVSWRGEGRSALFLPEVAPQQGWDIEELMNHLCRKAGLDPDAWRRGGELYTFQTVVFQEPDER